MKTKLLLLSLCLGLLSFGCGRKSAQGFRLPDGNVADGKVTFVELGCSNCHTIEGEDLPPPRAENKVPAIGGTTVNLPTDGQLVTSLINPSHRIKREVDTKSTGKTGASLMPRYSDLMTVRQMIDLVAYLHTVHHLELSEGPM